MLNKPPMGWNTWNTFGENINEKLILETADAMVNKGYLDAGYEYLIIDDCWSLRERDENGKLVCDPEKFPHGMKYIADYIHAKGLKFGMYSCAGTLTCAGYPGSYNHEFEDAESFAQWGVDYLKYDYCYFPKEANCKAAYTKMSMALKASGRDILLAACNWGSGEPWKWMRSRGAHTYRSTGDIFDNFKSFYDICTSQVENLSMSAPGCFNDPDMLIAGMFGKGNVGIENGCSFNEYKMHFAMWCMMSAPLIIGADIRNLDTSCEELLKCRELISVDQDEEVRPPFEVSGSIYIKFLSNNEFMIGFFNEEERDTLKIFSFNDVGLPDNSGYSFAFTDLITGEELGVKRDCFRVKLQSHDCAVYKAKIIKR